MANLRPFQVIVLAIFGIVALLALALFASFQGFGRTDEEVGPVAIWGTLPARQVEPALNELKRLHKEYAQVTYTERSRETLDSDIANAIASGTGPDLVLMSHEHLMAERSRLAAIPFSSLSERTFRDRYLPVFDVYLSADGSYGIPVLVDPIVLFYSEEALLSVGAARPPASWEAVAGLTPALTRTTDAQTITRSAIGLGGYENIQNAHAIISLLLLQAGVPLAEETPQGVRASLAGAGGALGVAPGESALNFYTEFANPSKTTYTWNRALGNSRQLFATGDLALYLGFASERAVIAATNPNLRFDMAAAPQPGTATAKVTYGRAYAFVIPKASRNAGSAYEVAHAFTARDVLPTLARSVGMAPGVRELLVPSSQDLFEPVYYPQALISRAWLSPAPPTLDSIFAAMIGNVTSGRMKPQDALRSAEQAMNAALSR